jgi:hypothetical protein
MAGARCVSCAVVEGAVKKESGGGSNAALIVSRAMRVTFDSS